MHPQHPGTLILAQSRRGYDRGYGPIGRGPRTGMFMGQQTRSDVRDLIANKAPIIAATQQAGLATFPAWLAKDPVAAGRWQAQWAMFMAAWGVAKAAGDKIVATSSPLAPEHAPAAVEWNKLLAALKGATPELGFENLRLRLVVARNQLGLPPFGAASVQPDPKSDFDSQVYSNPFGRALQGGLDQVFSPGSTAPLVDIKALEKDVEDVWEKAKPWVIGGAGLIGLALLASLGRSL